MKNPLFIFCLLPAISLLFISGCDLFGDETHCQNETSESKIWTSLSGNPVALNTFGVEFAFNRSDKWSERSYLIDNICPLGAMAVKVTVYEEDPGAMPSPNTYLVYILEKVDKNALYKIKRTWHLTRLSDTEWKTEGVIDLIGLPEQGPRTYFFSVVAEFADGNLFPDKLALENWASENVAQVITEVNYVKYE